VGILNIDASQVKTNVRKQVGDLYITANQTDYIIRKLVKILYIVVNQADNTIVSENWWEPYTMYIAASQGTTVPENS
jgi:hypothetical protein